MLGTNTQIHLICKIETALHKHTKNYVNNIYVYIYIYIHMNLYVYKYTAYDVQCIFEVPPIGWEIGHSQFVVKLILKIC